MSTEARPTLDPVILRHALTQPDAIAIETFDRAWTWRALAAEVDHWAGATVLSTLPRGAAFGWLGVNSVPMLAALLACSRLGLRFVPLNWRLASAELSTIATHAGLAAVHADDGFDALDNWQPAAAVEVAGCDDDLLLVYTSGTTGEPKAAIHTHAGMLANVDAAIDAQALDAHTRALSVLPMFHVGGLCIQALPTLAAGGVLRLHGRFDPAAWLADVQQWRPTTSLLVPATMRAVIEHPAWASCDLQCLAFLSAGSSILPPGLIEAFHARRVPVVQVYGATETGPVTIVLRAHEAMAHPGSVGRPALGVEIRLVESEVWVRAPNVARGYHGRPDDPAFADGWFHTGDLAQINAEGFYSIVGRSKEMIISGGENIYPAEIENIALADAAVAECAVVGLPDDRWGEVPVLVVVTRAGQALDRLRLQVSFDARLARFKHPRRTVEMAALPKTALGKVARAALVQSLLA